jgi:GAF domain-containing protein
LIVAAQQFRRLGLQPRLDAAATEAARLADCPIAAISMVLRRSQRFLAAHGLPPDLNTSRSTDRCSAFCEQVARDRNVVRIDDTPATVGPEHPLVSRYGVRAYLGVPIRAAGHVVGALCVMDMVPRAFPDSAIESLRRIGAQVEELLSASVDASARVSALTGHAARPAFAELRNILRRISVASGLLETALADLSGGGELLAAAARGELTVEQLARNAAVLGTASLAAADARSLLPKLDDDFAQAARAIDALEQVSAR